MIDACATVCSERAAQLIVGAGTNNTARRPSPRSRRSPARPALAATLIVVPYYVRPSEAGIVAHFRRGGRREPGARRPLQHRDAHRPQPQRRGRARSGAAPEHRRDQAGGDRPGPRHPRAARRRADDFAVLGGEDPFLFPLVLMGGAGAICASAHVCTERFVAMIECGLAGKVDDGRAHAEALLPVVQSLLRRAEPGGVQGRAPRAGSHPDPRRAPARW